MKKYNPYIKIITNKLNTLFLIIFIGMGVITYISLRWNLNEVERNIDEVVKNQARAFFSEIISTRAWNAGHHGVYVPVTERIKPNKYLEIKDRDVYTTDSVLLTKINPAFMTRLISEISEQKDGIKYHITSLKPIRPANEADEWERKALSEFELGVKDIFQLIKKDSIYRFMAPLYVNKVCMKCHAKQGYKIGDIRGGISINIPGKKFYKPVKKQKKQIVYMHILVLVSSIFMTIVFIIIINIQFIKINKRNILLSSQKKQITIKSKELHDANSKILRNNMQLEHQSVKIKKSYHNLELLSDIGKKIVSLLTVEDIITQAYDNIKELMEVSFFAVGVYNKEKDRIEFPGTIMDKNVLPSYSYETSRPNSLSAWCFLNKKEIYINNLKKEYNKYLNTYPKLRFEAQSFLYCPLQIKNEIIGTVTVHHEKTNFFTEFQLFALRNIAVYISLALQNADSYRMIEKQMVVIDDKNTLLQSSIKYAHNIQNAMFLSKEVFKEKFNTEILYIPRDIVSGDFYWAAEIENRETKNKIKYIAAVDCTGHGVPGAFLSVIGHNSLNQITIDRRIVEPSNILYKLNEKVVASLNQEYSDNRDGMDVCLCSIEELKNDKRKIVFCGAKLPLFYYKKSSGKVEYIKGSTKTIGGFYFKKQKFKDVEFIAEKGDILYLATDGYTDQDSQEKKRFSRAKFIQLIDEIVKYPIDKQIKIMNEIFVLHSKNKPQRDDITNMIIQL